MECGLLKILLVRSAVRCSIQSHRVLTLYPTDAQRPLHALYNGPFRRRDIRARQSLASVIDEVTYRSGSSTHVYSHSHSHSNGGLRKR